MNPMRTEAMRKGKQHKMKKNKKHISGKGPVFLCAAILSAVLCGCSDAPDWDDSLPEVVTDTSPFSVIYETEETTTTTPPVTIITTEKTKRTAASETTPELATTTPTQSTTTAIPTDIPNIPILEFTSSTGLDIETALPTTTSETESTGGVVEKDPDGTITSIVEINTVQTPFSSNEIERPYSYNQLNEKQTYIYDAVISAVMKLKTDVNFSSVYEITADEYCEVYQQIYNDEHALFYIGTKMQYAINSSTNKIASAVIFYKYSNEKIAAMQNEIEAEVNKVLSEVTEDMSEYEIVKYFYDYLASNVVYDEGEDNCRDIYGVFVKKKAICGGYSKAFSYLCDKVGIETVTVTGEADGEAHMWNMVKIDGKWYNIDVTYGVTDSKTEKYVRYDYFCVTDAMLADSRTIYKQNYTYPAATSDEYNYYIKNGLVADSWEDAKAILLNQIYECSKNKETVIQIKCATKALYDDVSYKLFAPTQKQAISVFEEALITAENKYDCNTINYTQDSTSLVIKLFLNYLT